MQFIIFLIENNVTTTHPHVLTHSPMLPPCFHASYFSAKPVEPSEMKENSKHIDKLHMAEFVAARNYFDKSGSKWAHFASVYRESCSSNMGSRNLVSLYSSELCRLKKEKKLMCFTAKNCRGCTFKQVLTLTVSARRHFLEQRTLAKSMRSFTYNLRRAGFQRRLLSFHLVSVHVNCGVNTYFQHLLLLQCCGYRVTSSHSTFDVHARPVI